MGHAASGLSDGLSTSIVRCMTATGCDQAVSFETSAKTVVTSNGIQPWVAKELIKENMKRQQAFAKHSPLRYVPIEDGLQHFSKSIGNTMWSEGLTRERFEQIAVELLNSKGINYTHKEREELGVIFDTMDYDKNGSLGVGEWAGGLIIFFQGTQEKAVHAVFKTLDRDRRQSLSKSELQEYFRPYVKAMTPPEAESLRPLLLKKATDDIYKEMDLDHNYFISSKELWEWTKRGNSILDRLTDIIDKEVYKIWANVRHKERRSNHSHHQRYGKVPRPEQYSPAPPQDNVPSNPGRGPSPSFSGGPFTNSMDLCRVDSQARSFGAGVNSHYLRSSMEPYGQSNVEDFFGRSRGSTHHHGSHVESGVDRFPFGPSMSSWGFSGDYYDGHSQSPGVESGSYSQQGLHHSEVRGPARNAPYEMYGRDNFRSVPAPPPPPYREQHGVQNKTKESDYGPPPPLDQQAGYSQHYRSSAPNSVFGGMFGS